MWKKVKLCDVCTINNGGTPKSKEKTYWGDEIQWLTPKDMGKLSSRYVSKTGRQITSLGLQNSSAKLVPENSVILSCRAPIGHVAINETQMSFNQGCKGLVTKDNIIVEYLFYFLVASKSLLNNLGTGTTFKEISSKTLANVEIHLPPLAEQQRIVAKLDAAFAEIDKAVVATKQETSQTTSLYNCMVKSLITDEINDSEACCIGDLVEEIVTGPFGSALHKSDYIENGIPVINPQNLFNGNIVPNYGKSISLEMADSLSKYKLRVGDILIGRRGEMGRCALVSDNESDYICGTGCMIVRPNGKVGKQFLFEILQSNYVKKKLEEGAVGATMLNLNQKILLSIPISIRSLDEQEKSIDAIYAYGNDTQKFNFNLERKIELLSVLKSAILAQELKGETA